MGQCHSSTAPPHRNSPHTLCTAPLTPSGTNGRQAIAPLGQSPIGRPVALGCNIHDQMAAWVVVVDSPWFTHSKATGSATISDVPEGEYVLSAWHPGLKNGQVTQTVRVDGNATPHVLRLDALPLEALLPDTEGHVHGTTEQ